MNKDITYREKFALLKTWIPHIIDAIKKDLRNEHLKNDWGFIKRYFPGKNVNKLTTEELSAAYSSALEDSESGEQIGEFISNRWLLKNTELYYFFEKELSKINPNFNELEEIDKEKSLEIMEGSIQHFGAVPTYFFAVLNSVVFPEEVYGILAERAEESNAKAQAESVQKEEKQTFEEMRRSYEQQISRLADRYEKKLLGMQKKYYLDVEALKKQLSSLQRKLAAK